MERVCSEELGVRGRMSQFRYDILNEDGETVALEWEFPEPDDERVLSTIYASRISDELDYNIHTYELTDSGMRCEYLSDAVESYRYRGVVPVETYVPTASLSYLLGNPDGTSGNVLVVDDEPVFIDYEMAFTRLDSYSSLHDESFVSLTLRRYTETGASITDCSVEEMESLILEAAVEMAQVILDADWTYRMDSLFGTILASNCEYVIDTHGDDQ